MSNDKEKEFQRREMEKLREKLEESQRQNPMPQTDQSYQTPAPDKKDVEEKYQPTTNELDDNSPPDDE